MAAAGALGSLGSDLAFSVSFGIANELVAAAHEAHLSEDELIGIVLVLTVLLAALPSSFASIREEWEKVRELVLTALLAALPSSFASMLKGCMQKQRGGSADRKQPPASAIFEFATLLLNMAQRISLSICVQLVAQNVRSRQPLRSVRVVSLLAVIVFFLFLESTSSVGGGERRR